MSGARDDDGAMLSVAPLAVRLTANRGRSCCPIGLLPAEILAVSTPGSRARSPRALVAATVVAKIVECTPGINGVRINGEVCGGVLAPVVIFTWPSDCRVERGHGTPMIHGPCVSRRIENHRAVRTSALVDCLMRSSCEGR